MAIHIYLFRDILAFLCCHLLGNGNDTNATKIETVGIKTSIDGGIASAMGASMETASFLKQSELFIR